MTDKALQWDEQLVLLSIGLLFIILMGWLASVTGFYRKLPKGDSHPPFIGFREVLGAFVVFLIIQVIIVPLIAYGYLSYKAGKWLTNNIEISSHVQAWLNVIGMLLSGVGLWFYCRFLEPAAGKKILGENFGAPNQLSQFSFGILAWFISYPLVFTLSQILGIFVEKVFHPPEVDQVAVKLLKNSLKDPVQFGLTMFGIICIVPIIEEILFRGFLQTWLKQKWGAIVGIITSSLIFAAFHYSESQGWHNIDLLFTLFFLSCFLGYIFERQGSLWAPIGLHMMFNLVSVSLIVWSGYEKV